MLLQGEIRGEGYFLCFLCFVVFLVFSSAWGKGKGSTISEVVHMHHGHAPTQLEPPLGGTRRLHPTHIVLL